MKTIFTFLASLLVSVSLLAADMRPKSTLTIKSSDRSSIRVVIDGRRFEPLDNYVRIQGIDAGYHNIKIYREKYAGFFNIFGKMYEVVFNNSIAVKPRTDVVLSVDRFGRTTVNEIRKGGFGRRNFDDGDWRWDRNHDFNYDNGGRYGDYDNGRGGKFGNQDRDDHDGRFDGRDDHGYNDNSFNRAMSDFEFSRVLGLIEKEWSENNKMKSATQIISTNYFTTAQVKQMLQMFSLENNKLDLAEQAYSKTVDQKNYFMVSDVFSFSSSKEELARYIRSH
jgi:Domain of unknown function (DUF4476)